MGGGVRIRQRRTRPRLFISYAREAPGHKELARTLAAELREQKFTCTLDQDVEPSPPEGWVPWMHREMQRADSILVLWSREYRKAFERQEKRGVPYEYTLLLKLAFARLPSLEGFVSCVRRESDLRFVDILFSDHVSFVLPRDASRLAAHLGNAKPSRNGMKTRIVAQKRPVRPEPAPPPPKRAALSRFVFDFSKEASVTGGSRRLDLLSGLRRRLRRSGQALDGSLLQEIVRKQPQAERKRVLELVRTAEGFSLLRYPGHPPGERIGDPVSPDEPHDFEWRLARDGSTRVHGRLLLGKESGFLLLSRVGASPSIRIEIRQLPRLPERGSQP